MQSAAPKVLFLLVGEGAEKERLISLVRSRGLTNLRFVEQQSRDKIPAYICASDACLVSAQEKRYIQDRDSQQNAGVHVLCASGDSWSGRSGTPDSGAGPGLESALSQAIHLNWRRPFCVWPQPAPPGNAGPQRATARPATLLAASNGTDVRRCAECTPGRREESARSRRDPKGREDLRDRWPTMLAAVAACMAMSTVRRHHHLARTARDEEDIVRLHGNIHGPWPAASFSAELGFPSFRSDPCAGS